MTKVTNMKTQDTQYFSVDAKQAVICAYAQSKKDYNTWNYNKYSSKVEEGTYHYFCGDFAARK